MFLVYFSFYATVHYQTPMVSSVLKALSSKLSIVFSFTYWSYYEPEAEEAAAAAATAAAAAAL